MPTKNELEYLDYVQDEAELLADEAEATTGIARREFVFLSLASAAATTFGFGPRALAQGTPGATQSAQAPPPPLGVQGDDEQVARPFHIHPVDGFPVGIRPGSPGGQMIDLMRLYLRQPRRCGLGVRDI